MNKHSYLVSGTCNAGNFCLSVDADSPEQAEQICTSDLHAAGYDNVKITKTEISRLISTPN